MLIQGAVLEAPAAPLYEVLGPRLAARPDELALVSDERHMTWRQVENASLALAGAYLEMGLDRGNRIASLMPNRISPASRPDWSRPRATTAIPTARSITRSR